MRLVIVGNGILAMMTARAWLERDGEAEVTVVGPHERPGSASRAAAAMLNSFAELEHDSLRNPLDRFKFDLSRAATDAWPAVFDDFAGEDITHGFGTYVLNNTATDELDDDNFDAVERFCVQYDEPHERVDPDDIPNYSPDPRYRALRALLLKREGWVNPKQFLDALTRRIVAHPRASLIDASAAGLRQENGRIASVLLTGGETVEGDHVLLANGAGLTALLDASLPELPVQRVFFGVGMSIELQSAEHAHTHCVRTTNRGLACGIYSVPYGPGRTLIGATNYISPTPVDFAHVGSAYSMLKSAMDQINSQFMRASLVTTNVGWRPTSSDTYPLIGGTSVENLWITTGTKRDGFHLSPVISRDIVSMIHGESVDAGYAALAPERPLIHNVSRSDAIERGVRHLMNASLQHDFVPARNRMNEQLERAWRTDLEGVHDTVGALDWGIPIELIDMHRYGHIRGLPS